MFLHNLHELLRVREGVLSQISLITCHSDGAHSEIQGLWNYTKNIHVISASFRLNNLWENLCSSHVAFQPSHLVALRIQIMYQGLRPRRRVFFFFNEHLFFQQFLMRRQRMCGRLEREAALLASCFRVLLTFCAALWLKISTFQRGADGVSADVFPGDQSSKQIQHEKCFAGAMAPQE